MAFIITLISFLIERFFDWSHLRQWRWFSNYHTWIGLRFANWNSYLILAACILPPVLVAGFVSHILTLPLYGFFKIIFGVIVVVYCLGPQNFWAQMYSCVHDTDNKVVVEKVQRMFGVEITEDTQGFHRAFTNALFVAAERRVFGVFFWFLVLGPAGAVLYRLTDLCKTKGIGANYAASQLLDLLDWPAVRVFTIVFALGGHCKNVLHHWKQHVFTSPRENDVMLTECGVAALDVSYEKQLPEDGLAERETLELLDRVFIVSLVILALIVLI